MGRNNLRWCASDPLPPSAALPLERGRIKLSCCGRNLPLVRGKRERSERGGRSHTISNWTRRRRPPPHRGFLARMIE
jgi:hypothetical protein